MREEEEGKITDGGLERAVVEDARKRMGTVQISFGNFSSPTTPLFL